MFRRNNLSLLSVKKCSDETILPNKYIYNVCHETIHKQQIKKEVEKINSLPLYNFN